MVITFADELRPHVSAMTRTLARQESLAFIRIHAHWRQAVSRYRSARVCGRADKPRLRLDASIWLICTVPRSKARAQIVRYKSQSVRAF